MTAGGQPMDLEALRNEALEATTRFFIDRDGVLPDQDSDEWEAEYHRQFELAKRRAATQRSAAEPGKPSASGHPEWPALVGEAAEKRWGIELRAARLKEIQSKVLRDWLVAAWTAASDWIKTREMPGPAFLRRVEAQYATDRRQAEAQAAARAAGEQAKTAAAQAVRGRVRAAGITAAGLIDLVDVSPRAAAAPLRGKLAELRAGDRSLRIFETSSLEVLAVIEKGETGRTEYAVERDEGLVADLKLFAEAEAADRK